MGFYVIGGLRSLDQRPSREETCKVFDLFVRPESTGGKTTDTGCGGIEILSANIPVGEGKAAETGCGGIEILSANITAGEGKITDTDCGNLSVGATSPEDHGHD